jgi:hypothetical protein
MGIFEKREQNSTPPVSLLILIWEDFLGEGRETERSVLRRQTELQRGIRKDLWPKYFPKCPVARHFVCPKEKHVGYHC